ncbi:hypothetical protein COLO4_28419 [Corchorus olitorius]|uniref:Uncharacterized protein n=1 Tax=Corchorus olitorius TaxID=93759 RepID=A0A1R3HL17_9ROSI|nr:hypothetical protein COLO4_28419 [Corchorus olitorius]
MEIRIGSILLRYGQGQEIMCTCGKVTELANQAATKIKTDDFMLNS